MIHSHRHNRLGWHELGMLEAILISERSPDPNTQVGCCLIDQNMIQIGKGYNGAPRGMDLDAMPWGREGNPEDTKYPYVVHAEVNCILNTSAPTKGSFMYCTLFPCNECMKFIISAQVGLLYYMEDKYADLWSTKVAKRMASAVDLPCLQYKPSQNAIDLLIERLRKVR